LRMEMYEVDDNLNLVVKAEFNNITFNAGIPDSEFIFEVPEGVSLVSDDEVPDATPTAPASEAVSGSIMAPPIFTNWKYIIYQNLSISNAPALNQTARITYSIIPDRDIEILSVQISIPDDGFELIDIDDTWPNTLYNRTRRDTNNARWYPTNLSKDTLYQFNATLKAVKTGNWTIMPCGSNKGMYISVSEDSAYISDGPFPDPPLIGITYFLDESELNESEIEKALANIPTNEGLTVYRSTKFPITTTTTPSKPSKHTTTLRPTPCPTSCSFDVNPGGETCTGLSYHWNGTAWVERNNQS
ncbi:MAG: hypothetical protein C4B59_17410, partial [Candidatus Methanogaster sp.]